MFASASHKGDYFEEIVAEPQAIIKGDYEFLSPLKNLEEIIFKLNGYKEEGLSDEYTLYSFYPYVLLIFLVVLLYE